MKKDDYKTEFEEHRKEISLDEGHDDSLPSRAELHRKGRKPKKKSGHLLINVILGLFTLIPVLILVYFLSDFYLPEESTKAKNESSGSIYEINNTANKKPEDTKLDVDSENKKESGKAEGVTKPDSEKKPEKKVEEKVETKPEKKVEEKTETKPVVNVNPTPETKPAKTPETKTHIVASGENLYRIALKHYGSGSDAEIEKIKRANGLSSIEIRVGQKLIIP